MIKSRSLTLIALAIAAAFTGIAAAQQTTTAKFIDVGLVANAKQAFPAEVKTMAGTGTAGDKWASCEHNVSLCKTATFYGYFGPENARSGKRPCDYNADNNTLTCYLKAGENGTQYWVGAKAANGTEYAFADSKYK